MQISCYVAILDKNVSARNLKDLPPHPALCRQRVQKVQLEALQFSSFIQMSSHRWWAGGRVSLQSLCGDGLTCWLTQCDFSAVLRMSTW